MLGSGHPLGDIFLLKHDPTPAELTEGVAFYGRVGQAVLKSVQRLDIDPLLVYGTNVVKLGGDHGRDERELAERVYPMWLLRELHIVQPKVVVIMGEDTLAVVNNLDLALAKPLEPELGVIQHLTPTIEALVTPPLEPSLDDAAAKRRFWAAFRALARAISEVNALGDEIARRGDAPTRQPVLGSGHPLGDIFLLKHDPTLRRAPPRASRSTAASARRCSSRCSASASTRCSWYGTNVVKLGGDHGRDESELAERVYPMLAPARAPTSSSRRSWSSWARTRWWS